MASDSKDDDPRQGDPQDDDPEDADPGLARARTRLAWARTALAFAALGVTVLRKDVADGLIVLATVPLVWAVGYFLLRAADPDRSQTRLLLVTASVILAAVLATFVAFLGHAPASLDQIFPRHG
jgi:uncharacterized membrane protein YidH (DUF202 family)